jgi:hypothetical protein
MVGATGLTARRSLAPYLLQATDLEMGRRPQALATPNRSTMAVYLPVGGEVSLPVQKNEERKDQWFDPRTGALLQAEGRETEIVKYFQPRRMTRTGIPSTGF